ncbi:MAG: hypothetical protein WDZ39_00105 [Candidatus Spechtbacterales bacterium]
MLWSVLSKYTRKWEGKMVDVAGLAEVLKPEIEEAYGKLPYFEFRSNDSPPAYTPKTPWAINVDNEMRAWFVEYYPNNVNVYSESWNGIAYLIQALIHDISHLYQMEPERNKVGKPWRETGFSKTTTRQSPKSRSAFNHWSEGGAELAAYKILSGILFGRKNYNELLREIGQFFQNGDGADLKTYMENYFLGSFAQKIIILCKHGALANPSLKELALPFNVTKNAQSTIEQRAEKYLFEPVKHYNFRLAYSLGLMRCGAIVAAGDMTIAEILRTPITSRKLRELANSN